jgi:hypothetical protein
MKVIETFKNNMAEFKAEKKVFEEDFYSKQMETNIKLQTVNEKVRSCDNYMRVNENASKIIHDEIKNMIQFNGESRD